MAYCDYEFYTTEYLGNVITEADFPRLSQRASDKIDVITFDRLAEGLPTDERVAKKVKKAVCAVAELMLDYENANSTMRNNGGLVVSSVSSGSESISYKTDAQISEKEHNIEIRQVATDYLIGTGLLYAGL